MVCCWPVAADQRFRTAKKSGLQNFDKDSISDEAQALGISCTLAMPQEANACITMPILQIQATLLYAKRVPLE